MQINKLRNIIYFNQKHQKQVEDLASLVGIENDINTKFIDIRNVLRELCNKLGISIFEIPIIDKEIGAIFYIQDGKKYILLNSNIPRVNINFAIAHELYHIYVKDSAMNYNNGDVFIIDEYMDNENEMLANAFAAELLMPKFEVSYIYHFFSKENNNDFELIIKLMNYFSTPYMSVLIRLLEIDKLKDSSLIDLVNKSEDEIMEAAREYKIDTDLLKPSQRDDTDAIIESLTKEGNRLIEKDLLSPEQLKRTIDKVEKILMKLSGK